ncbi:MAG: hypothetical protein H0T79_07025 [Deltaproteobacteria bacterium]|nr:hypothetical protein [Deltaproteobacteria bacterium]
MSSFSARARAGLAFVIVTAVATASGTPALAQPKGPTPAPAKTTCEFFEVSATTTKDAKEMTLDPDLKPLEKKLKKKPFSSWNTFKTLSHGTKVLARNMSEALPLKSGKASTMLVEVVGKSKVRLEVQADDPAGKRWVNTKVEIDAADFVVWVRETPNDTGYLLALTCR